MVALDALLLVLASAVLAPLAILTVECLIAALPWWPGERRPAPSGARRSACVVLMPAHDEAEIIGAAIATVQPQLGEGDRILVVAHNCSDRTAAVAREAGADVVEEQDDGTGGKPYALRAGCEALRDDPPEVVVIVDADCDLGAGAIDALVRACTLRGSPVQGVYTFEAAETEKSLGSISSLALLVKNLVRPTALHRLGLPCLITGSACAFPFQALAAAPQGEGSVSEDDQLTIDLLLAGHPTRFVPEARVSSVLPGVRRIARKQRTRWEHGHIWLVIHTVPRLLVTALRRGSADILALALEISVPPLSFLVLIWLSCVLATLGAHHFLGADPLALWMLGVGAASAGLAMLFALSRFLGPLRALGLLVRIPAYVLWKIPLYLAYLVNRETVWKKTPRDHEVT